jgi:hypothetical protein
MLRAGFEPTMSVFERSKTVRALDRCSTPAFKLPSQKGCEGIKLIFVHILFLCVTWLSVVTAWRVLRRRPVDMEGRIEYAVADNR